MRNEQTESNRSPANPEVMGRARRSPSLGTPSLEATSTENLRLGWRFWLAVAGFWALFGFVVGNHVYFGMRGHGHAWGRIILWQVGGASAWILLTPAVLALDRWFPFRAGRIRVAMGVHTIAAIVFAAIRLVPLTAFSLLVDPFRPVPREASFRGEYAQLLAEWVFLDVIVYVAILLFARMLEYRERHYRDQLRASHLRAELSAAELRALELEVHPHFLFNALNAISVLVREGDRERASRMVVGLADLLRLTLKRRGRVFMSLAEEIDHVRLYFDVQKARFEDRLAVEIDLDDSVKHAMVPGLVLQPLVENAFRHGIEKKRGQGIVRVRAQWVSNRLELIIEDNGPGIAPTGDPGANHNGQSAVEPGNGIGLSNLRSRLDTLYEPDRWSLDLTSEPGAGTRVVVRLPFEEREL